MRLWSVSGEVRVRTGEMVDRVIEGAYEGGGRV